MVTVAGKTALKRNILQWHLHNTTVDIDVNDSGDCPYWDGLTQLVESIRRVMLRSQCGARDCETSDKYTDCSSNNSDITGSRSNSCSYNHIGIMPSSGDDTTSASTDKINDAMGKDQQSNRFPFQHVPLPRFNHLVSMKTPLSRRRLAHADTGLYLTLSHVKFARAESEDKFANLLVQALQVKTCPEGDRVLLTPEFLPVTFQVNSSIVTKILSTIAALPCTHLVDLRLQKCQLERPEHMNCIAALLRSSPLLASLDLSHNSIRAGGLECLLPTLRVHQRLRKLDFSSCQLTERGAILIAKQLLPVNLNLKWVSLANNHILHSGIRALNEKLSLQSYGSLIHLNLSGNAGCHPWFQDEIEKYLYINKKESVADMSFLVTLIVMARTLLSPIRPASLTLAVLPWEIRMAIFRQVCHSIYWREITPIIPKERPNQYPPLLLYRPATRRFLSQPPTSSSTLMRRISQQMRQSEESIISIIVAFAIRRETIGSVRFSLCLDAAEIIRVCHCVSKYYSSIPI